LGQVRFVAEPVAAAAYFAAVLGRQIPAERCIVVYDLGAGTFDASVVRPGPGGFDVVTSAGLPDMGGLDLDAVVVRHAHTLTAEATGAWQRLDWPQNPADQQARHTLWQGARAVKEQLSRHPTGDLYLPLVDRQVHLTRDEFEKAARSYLDRTAALTLRVLAEAGISPEEIGGVFPVGGSSRIPLVATLLHRTLRIAPTVIDQPELVVAEGALHTHPTMSNPVTGTSPAGTAQPAPLSPAASSARASAGPAPAATAALTAPEPSWPTASLPTSPRRRPVRIIAATAVGVLIVAAAVLAVTRPWRYVPGAGATGAGASPSVCAPYEKFGDLNGRTVTVFSDIEAPDATAHTNSYKPFEECTGVTIRYESSRSSPTQVLALAQAGNPPDIAYVPQPDLLQRLVATGRVKQAPAETVANVDKWFSKDWKAYGTVNGKLYAAPLNAQVKSLVWYSPKEFKDQGYNTPETLDELKALSDHIANRGKKPWCAGIASGSATGWVVTDWVEDFLLRLSGPDEYDKWVSHVKPFNSAESTAAFDAVGAYLKNDRYVNGGFGGAKSIATTTFQDAGQPILQGTCSLHRQSDFYATLWPTGTKVAEDGDVFAFYLPGKDAGAKPVLGAGEFVVAFADRPEVKAFQTFLSSDWWANLKAAQGGSVVSANTGLKINQCTKCTPIDRLALGLLQDPQTVFRFDGSDLMPSGIGADAFWTQATNWILGQSTKQTVDSVEAAWPR
jgi:alpha-glucoside transport system substrate-binding protein